jgi:hypothetical protein
MRAMLAWIDRAPREHQQSAESAMRSMRIKSRQELLEVANHGFLMIAMLFVLIMNLTETPPTLQAPMVAQALQFQPRTPPPVMDPDHIDSVMEDLQVDTHP